MKTLKVFAVIIVITFFAFFGGFALGKMYFENCPDVIEQSMEVESDSTEVPNMDQLKAEEIKQE